jgi:hypothetical protein
MTWKAGVCAAAGATGRKESLVPLLNAAVQARHTPTGSAMLGGMLSFVCVTLDKVQAAGLKLPLATERGQEIANATPDIRVLLMSALGANIDQPAADVIGDLAAALHSVRAHIGVEQKAVESAPPEPPPPVMRVEIVGMPARTTETTFQRDENLEIARSVQTGRDG